MYVIVHQGGGFKGAFGVPILRALVEQRKPDLILGVSVGALNGVLAAQQDFDLLERIWNKVDGVKDFLLPGLARGKGLYHLEPLRALIDTHVVLKKVVIPFGCGAVARETCVYENFLTQDMRNDRQLRDAVEASSAIAGLMEPVKFRHGGKPKTWSDGGHVHSLPPLPPDVETKVTAVDLILMNPVKSDDRPSTEVDGLMESIEWIIHVSSANLQAQDLNDYQRVVRQRGAKVRIFSPEKDLGGLLDARPKTISSRMDEGRRALQRPITLL